MNGDIIATASGSDEQRATWFASSFGANEVLVRATNGAGLVSEVGTTVLVVG